jgi:hypothetical protein
MRDRVEGSAVAFLASNPDTASGASLIEMEFHLDVNADGNGLPVLHRRSESVLLDSF